MPRYFFNRPDGGVTRDAEGTELPDLAAARLEAVRYAAESARDRPHDVWSGRDVRIEVTDGDGVHLCTVVVLGIDAPAARTADGESV